MSKTDKKIVPERVKIPAYGDERIEEAKGKSRKQPHFSYLCEQ